MNCVKDELIKNYPEVRDFVIYQISELSHQLIAWAEKKVSEKKQEFKEISDKSAPIQ